LRKEVKWEITEFDFAVFEEDILSFEIPMQYFLIMQIIQCKTNLHEPVHYLCFCEQFALGLEDPVVHVAPLAVDHHYVQILFFVQERVFVSHDVRVTKFLKKTYLILEIFSKGGKK
jgi:hypothetical protein